MTKDSVSQNQRFYKFPKEAMDQLFDEKRVGGGCSDLFALMVYIVKRARFSAGVVQLEHGRGSTHIQLKPGQCIVGSRQGAKDLHCGDATFRRRLQKLVDLGFITIQPTCSCSVVTLCFAPEKLEQNTEMTHLKTSKTRGNRAENTENDRTNDALTTHQRRTNDDKGEGRGDKEDKSKPRKYPNEEEIKIFAEGLDQTSYPSATEQVHAFHDHYEANGWIQGKGSGRPIKNWQAAFRAWVRRSKQFAANGQPASESTSYQGRMEEARRQQGIENVRRLAEHAKLAKEAKQKRREASRAS